MKRLLTIKITLLLYLVLIPTTLADSVTNYYADLINSWGFKVQELPRLHVEGEDAYETQDILVERTALVINYDQVYAKALILICDQSIQFDGDRFCTSNLVESGKAEDVITLSDDTSEIQFLRFRHNRMVVFLIPATLFQNPEEADILQAYFEAYTEDYSSQANLHLDNGNRTSSYSEVLLIKVMLVLSSLLFLHHILYKLVGGPSNLLVSSTYKQLLQVLSNYLFEVSRAHLRFIPLSLGIAAMLFIYISLADRGQIDLPYLSDYLANAMDLHKIGDHVKSDLGHGLVFFTVAINLLLVVLSVLPYVFVGVVRKSTDILHLDVRFDFLSSITLAMFPLMLFILATDPGMERFLFAFIMCLSQLSICVIYAGRKYPDRSLIANAMHFNNLKHSAAYAFIFISVFFIFTRNPDIRNELEVVGNSKFITLPIEASTFLSLSDAYDVNDPLILGKYYFYDPQVTNILNMPLGEFNKSGHFAFFVADPSDYLEGLSKHPSIVNYFLTEDASNYLYVKNLASEHTTKLSFELNCTKALSSSRIKYRVYIAGQEKYDFELLRFPGCVAGEVLSFTRPLAVKMGGDVFIQLNLEDQEALRNLSLEQNDIPLAFTYLENPNYSNGLFKEYGKGRDLTVYSFGLKSSESFISNQASIDTSIKKVLDLYEDQENLKVTSTNTNAVFSRKQLRRN